MNNLLYRSELLRDVLSRYATASDSILEIGCGDNRNVDFLIKHGFKVEGIDKELGTSIEDFKQKEYDVIFTMSTLFLIPEESEWVFQKIANMAKKYILTIEGETTKDNGVIGRNYRKIFGAFDFEEVEYRKNVFNEYGVLRVFKRIK